MKFIVPVVTLATLSGVLAQANPAEVCASFKTKCLDTAKTACPDKTVVPFCNPFSCTCGTQKILDVGQVEPSLNATLGLPANTAANANPKDPKKSDALLTTISVVGLILAGIVLF